MEKNETNQITQEKEPVSKNMHKIIVNNRLNQHDEGMLTKEIFVSDTCCVCLKETSDALACKICHKKFISSVAMQVKVMKWVFCTTFVSKLKMLLKVK